MVLPSGLELNSRVEISRPAEGATRSLSIQVKHGLHLLALGGGRWRIRLVQGLLPVFDIAETHRRQVTQQRLDTPDRYGGRLSFCHDWRPLADGCPFQMPRPTGP